MKPFICLTYHRISSDVDALADPFTVTPEMFKRHMEQLVTWGYRGVSVSQALKNSTGRVVALSFDDGYTDFYETAWPVLKQHTFSASVFVVTGRTGQLADWRGGGNAPLMNWGQIGEIAQAGIEIGSHCVDHAALDSLRKSDIEYQIRTSYDHIQQRTGTTPAGLAYPYGNHNDRICDAARRAGYAWACTARGGKNQASTERMRLRRTLLTRQDRRRVDFAIHAKFGYATCTDIRMDLLRMR